jgi:hypothetical protein
MILRNFIIGVALILASTASAGDLVVKFDEDVSRLLVRLYTKDPSAILPSLDDAQEPGSPFYPSIEGEGRIATFANIPVGSCWVTIEDGASSWARSYIDVRKIEKTKLDQVVEWEIPNGVIDVKFQGKQESIIIKLERVSGGQVDRVFQKWLILKANETRNFIGRFPRVGKGEYVISFYEYSAEGGLASFICSCSATQNTSMSERGQ